MATVDGCITLLTALSALDPRIRFDAMSASVWASALRDLPDEILVQAGIDAARANAYGGMVNVGMIEKAAEPYLAKIRRDVRSARKRGYVPSDWPDTRPIPIDAQAKLTAAFEATNDYANEVEGGIRVPKLGQVGKDVRNA